MWPHQQHWHNLPVSARYSPLGLNFGSLAACHKICHNMLPQVHAVSIRGPTDAESARLRGPKTRNKRKGALNLAFGAIFRIDPNTTVQGSSIVFSQPFKGLDRLV